MPTLILRPNGAGSQEEITSQEPSSGAHWDKVDEAVADDATTYLYSTSNTELQDTLALPDTSLTGVIVSVTAYARCFSVSGNGRGATGIRTGGTIYRSSEQVLGNYWHDLDPHQMFVNPDTSVAWTWEDINSLEVLVYQRWSTASTEVRTTQVYVEVHYRPNTVVVLRPNAAGDVCGIPFEVGAACPDHYQNVDEVTPDDDTTFVKGTTWAGGGAPATAADLYNIENPAISTGIITNVAVYARFKDNADDQYREGRSYIFTKTGGSEHRSSKTQLGVWSDFHVDYANNPTTSSAWTWSEITALQIGANLFNPQRGSGIDFLDKFTFCTQMWIEITRDSITFPSDAITRVTNIIHRYNRDEQVYTMEISLGEVTSDFGLPEWASTPRTLAINQEKMKQESEIAAVVRRTLGIVEQFPGEAPPNLSEIVESGRAAIRRRTMGIVEQFPGEAPPDTDVGLFRREFGRPSPTQPTRRVRATRGGSGGVTQNQETERILRAQRGRTEPRTDIDELRRKTEERRRRRTGGDDFSRGFT